MNDYLESLEKQTDDLLKKRPDEINKLADEIKKTVVDCKKKGSDFDFDDLLRILLNI